MNSTAGLSHPHFLLGLFVVTPLLVSLLPSLTHKACSSHNSQNLIKMQILSYHRLQPLQWLPVSRQGKLKSLTLACKAWNDRGPTFSRIPHLILYRGSCCSLFSGNTDVHDRHTHPRTLGLTVSSTWNIIFPGVCMAHSNASFRSFININLSKNPSLTTLDRIISSLTLGSWLSISFKFTLIFFPL